MVLRQPAGSGMTSLEKPILLIFLKYPEPGTVKTRLAKDIGDVQAARIYKAMVERVIEKTASEAYQSILLLDPPERIRDFQSWLGPDPVYEPQPQGSLGQRLFKSFQRFSTYQPPSLLVIGTDCPDVDKGDIENAIRQLKTHDAVIGPACDGGYYLLGLSQAALEKTRDNLHRLFTDLPWSTDTVFERTCERLQELQLTWQCLDTKRDIDTKTDLDLTGFGRKQPEILCL